MRLKNVKLRVPEGRAEEAHKLLEGMGYKSKVIMIDAKLLRGHDSGCMSWEIDEARFDEFAAEEIYLPGHEPSAKLEASDGSTASYYELPEGATELQHLISHRNLNAQIGEIFRACYRYGMVEHSPQIRDIKKILFYAQAELERLEKQGGAA